MPVKDSIGIDWAIGGSEVKTSACNAGNLGLIPGLGGSPGEGNGSLLQCYLSGKAHGQRILGGYHSWLTKSWRQFCD